MTSPEFQSNPRIHEFVERAKRAAMEELKPTKSQLEHGLELYNSAVVVDTYGAGVTLHCIGPHSQEMEKWALDRLNAEKDPEKKLDRLKEIRSELIRWKPLEYANDAGVRAGHRAIWDASGVTIGLEPFALAWIPGPPKYAEPMDFIKAISRAVYLFENTGHVEKLTSLNDVDRLKAEGKHGAIWHSKEADAFFAGEGIEDPLENLSLFYGLGIRMSQLANSHKNRVGCSHNQEKDTGLTDLGREIVRRMNRLGMIVDLSHSGPETIRNTIDASLDPVVASHFACKGVSTGGKSAHRNITDENLKALADKGGMVGITMAPNLLGGFGIKQFLKHVEYAVKLIGADHVGIGTDETGLGYWMEPAEFLPLQRPKSFQPDRKPDGGFQIKGTKRYWLYNSEPDSMAWTNWPYFSAVALVCWGYSDEDILNIIGGNFLRIAGPILGKKPRGPLV